MNEINQSKFQTKDVEAKKRATKHQEQQLGEEE